MNISSQRRRGGKRTMSSPLHPPLPRPDPTALAPLHLRLRAFGVAPTPDPDESWHQLRPLLRTHTVTPLQRLRRRGIRGGAAAAAALMVFVTSVALAAEPVQRLVVGSAVSAWEGLMDLTGAGSDSDSIVRAESNRGGSGRGEEASPTGGEDDGGASDGPSSGGPGGDVAAAAPLVVRSDQKSVVEDTPTTINVLENDGRFGGGVKLQTSQPAHGTASANNRTITYTPPADFNGSDSFSYWVSDGETSARAEVTVAVTPVNDSPRAGNDKRSVDEDGSLVLDLLTNDGDVDGDQLSIKPDAPAHGRVEVKDGRLTYEPSADFNGEDTFSYQVSDGKGGSAVAKVAIKVRPVNDDPEAADDEADVQAGDSLLFEVLPNDKDVDNDPLSVDEATANHGEVHINPNGSLTYTPNPQFIGDDVISYTVSDGAGGTDRAKVMIHVVEPPPGEAETGSGAEGSSSGG
ncbi:MAG TPA: cadherin-like domain-containing protein [Actinomycetota bacterium]|nr:cadherin-like domain-containing protein [Actinomycetota bacterium]